MSLQLANEDFVSINVFSGIINKISRAAQSFTLSPIIKAGSLEPLLSSRHPRIEASQAELLTTLYPDLDNDSQAVATIVVFQMKVWELLVKPTRYGATKNMEESGHDLIEGYESDLSTLGEQAA